MPPPKVARLTALTLSKLPTAGARAIAQGHQAAYMVGVAERTGIAPKRLSNAEKAQLKQVVSGQLDRYAAMRAEDLSDAASAARQVLYARAVGASYWAGRSGQDLPVYPGACPDCWSNCRCDLEMQDDGVHWQCANDDRSCPGCVARGQDWQPYQGGGE